MTTKEYLDQVRWIEKEINFKREEIRRLREIDEKISPTISDIPGESTRNVHKIENNIVNIVDMENEIKEEMKKLISLRSEIRKKIENVDSKEQQFLLELRYFGNKTWEEIAVEMRYNIRHIYRLHKKALAQISIG